MDLYGETFKRLISQQRANQVHNAAVLAEDYKDEGMTKAQVSEMLYANGFEDEIVKEAIRQIYLEKE